MCTFIMYLFSSEKTSFYICTYKSCWSSRRFNNGTRNHCSISNEISTTKKKQSTQSPDSVYVYNYFIWTSIHSDLTLVSVRLNQLKTKVKHFLFELNLFKNQSLHDRHICYQRIGTKLYIIILIVSFIIFTLYSFLIKDVYRETILNPTESQ